MPLTNFPYGIYAVPMVGANLVDLFSGSRYANPKDPNGGNIYFVDGDYGTPGGPGHSPNEAFATITQALAVSGPGAVIYVKARNVAAGGTDPINYAETPIIGAAQFGTKIIGVSSGTKQLAQPQIKASAGAGSLLTMRAPGCLVHGLTFNGAGTTTQGILLDDDGTTKVAAGTIINSCVFKNCKGTGATDSSTGGAVNIASTGGAWDCAILNSLFYKNIGGFVLLGTSDAVPQDLLIENCQFTTDVSTDVDTYIWCHAGSGMVDVMIRNCEFGIFPSGNTKNTYMDLTACTGQMVGCRFASTGKTFGAAANVIIPTTVLMAANYQEHAAGGSGEIGRT